MANRRMFSKDIVNSARFLQMPPSSRLLYYDLGMAADDDGVVEAFTVMRMSGAVVDDLRVLAQKQFVTVLNDEMVTFINDWKRNNLIKNDRKHDSIYKDLLVKMLPGTQTEPKWNHYGTQMEPEVRLGKGRLGKDTTTPYPSTGGDGGERPDFNTVEVYAANNLQSLSPGNMAELVSFKDDMPDEMIRLAIDEACSHGARKWSYVKHILNRWLDAGIKTVGEAKAEAEKRESAKKPQAEKPKIKWG